MLLIAFKEGHRPTANRVLSAVRNHDQISISHSPADINETGWFELLMDGMTFDVSGFGPQSPIRISRPGNFVEHAAKSHWPDEQVGAIAIALGPHLAEATPNMPITRSLARLAAALSGSLDDVLSLIWRPADLAISPETFGPAIAKWVEAGRMPSEVFITAKSMPDNGIQSFGLGYFIGQELRVEPGNFEDQGEAYRLTRRLIDQFVLRGMVSEADQILGPDGVSLRIEPSGNNKFIRVFRG